MYAGVHGYHTRPLGAAFSVCETPDRLRGLENTTRSHIGNVVSNKQMTLEFIYQAITLEAELSAKVTLG